MSMRNDRRRVEAWKLRVLHDALNDAVATSDAQWVDAWIDSCRGGNDTAWVSRETFIEYLKNCIVAESAKLSESLAA